MPSSDWNTIKDTLIQQVEDTRDARLREEAAQNWLTAMTVPLLTLCLVVDYCTRWR